VGIYLPKEARFSVSDDGREFTEVATARPALAPSAPGPEICVLAASVHELI